MKPSKDEKMSNPILKQQAKRKRKKIKIKIHDAYLKPFVKAHFMQTLKIYDEYIALEKDKMNLERKKMTIMKDIRNYICSSMGGLE